MATELCRGTAFGVAGVLASLVGSRDAARFLRDVVDAASSTGELA